MNLCACPDPLEWVDSGNRLRCGLCWNFLPKPAKKPKPLKPARPRVHTKTLNDEAWIRHSERLGMEPERIARDLRLRVGVVEFALRQKG